MDIIQTLARELGESAQHVENVVRLLDEGNTIPFIARYSLAKLYLSDDLEVRDTRKGMNWLYTAAVNGSSYAMYRLAKECLKGELIEKDTAHAWSGSPSQPSGEISTPSTCWASCTLLVGRFSTMRSRPYTG